MNLVTAKAKLDSVIRKGRVHFYKPFQIAEVLRAHREGTIEDLEDLESYRNLSKRWRDDVSRRLVGRVSTSSARYQDDVFNGNSCPPSALAELGAYNVKRQGEVEAYVYRMFEQKLSLVDGIYQHVVAATTKDFRLADVIDAFETRPGLKRSIDKIFEIAVYALFSALVRALRLRVSLTIENPDAVLRNDFDGFLSKVVGMRSGSPTVVMEASLYRVGSTNAADTGLDMVANFGPAIQVKHLTLDAEAIADICDGISAERIVVVCKDAELQHISSLLAQVGLSYRLQGVVTLNDLVDWYALSMSAKYEKTLGTPLLKDFIREFVTEFPITSELTNFMSERGYDKIKLSPDWKIG